VLSDHAHNLERPRARDEHVEIVRGLRTASILKTILPTTKLAAFGSIDAPKPNARAVDLYRVAVDNARLAVEVGSQHGAGCHQQRSDQRYASEGIATDATFHSTNISVLRQLICRHAAAFRSISERQLLVEMPMKVLGAFVILYAAIVTPVSAKHHGRTHDHRHYRATNTWQYAPYSVPPALDRIDPSRPGGLDPSFTPRAR